MFPRFGLAAALVLSLAGAAQAQTDVFPDLWVTDLRVEGMAVLGDTLFVAGRFRQVGPPTGQLATLDKTTGEADLSQPRFSALGLSSQGITVVLPDGAGGYYVGGTFSAVAGQPRRNLARVLPDGTLDPGFHPDPQVTGQVGYYGSVAALALDSTASGARVLYLGGRFDTVSGQPRQNLAALDAATRSLLPLQATFAGTPFPNTSVPQVYSVLARAGILYVAGSFTAVGGQPRTSLAAFRTSTGELLPWAPAVVVAPPFAGLLLFRLVSGGGTLYAGGQFDSVNGQARDGLAELTLADPVTG